MDNKTMIKVINGMADKIDEFDNIIVEQYNLLYNKIDDLYIYSPKSDMCQRISDLENTIESLNKKVDNYEPENIIKSLEVTAEIIIKDKTSRLNDKIEGLTNVADNNTGCIASISDDLDELEAKNYQLKSEIDALKNEEETLTIGELLKCESWEDLNELRKSKRKEEQK